MRKRRRNSRIAPFGAGLLAGYILTGAIAAFGALLMCIMGADSGLSWLTAVPAEALGSFLCGRTAGKLRHRGGLKTGALCGLFYCLPLIMLSVFFGEIQGVLLPVKLALCIGFGAAGGVAGVNSQDKA